MRIASRTNAKIRRPTTSVGSFAGVGITNGILAHFGAVRGVRVHFDNLREWLRDGLLPTVLIVLGAALIARAIQWVSGRYRAELDAAARDIMEGGRVVPESMKRSRAVAQAVTWAAVSLTYFIAT